MFMAYKYPICDVFHWFCKKARFFATEPQKGQNWNAVKAVFPGKEPKFRSIESFLNEYNEYVEKFYKRQEAIAAEF